MARRAATLIEVVISLGLVTILLTTLFFWYWSISHDELDPWPTLQKRYCHQRLMQILPKIETPVFTVADGSFVFQFERSLTKNPLLSSKVVGRLYHDAHKKRLCLGIWPKPPLKSPSETHILLENVENVLFEFYYPPSLNRMPVQPEEVGHLHPKETWQESWSSEYALLPSLIKLSIKQTGEETREYQFDLPKPIYYDNAS